MPGSRTAMTQNAKPGSSLYRLLAWLSPSFPTGAFSYSHGLEAAVAADDVRDRASLENWVASVVARGSGRIDADILCEAYRVAAADDRAGFDAANRRGVAFRATAELALEAAQQGEAFMRTCRAAWQAPFLRSAILNPHPSPPPLAGEGADGTATSNFPLPPSLPSPASGGGQGGGETAPEHVCHSAAFGAAAACAGIALEDALVGYLQAFAANLVSAGLRLGIIGQTDGQRIMAALEPVVAGAADAAMTRDPADFGGATFAVDLASMAHETQYTRLFRS